MSDEHYEELDQESESDASEEEYGVESEFDPDEIENEIGLDAEELDSEDESDSEDEFEEITSEEVDRVIEALENLVENVESENIRAHLENAVNKIFYLVYSDEDLESDDDLADEAA